MKKILIIGYYELKEHILHIAEIFEQYGYIVENFPLFRFAHDINDKVDNYEELLDQCIKKVKPYMILWWFADVQPGVFKRIKNNNNDTIYVLFNGDDPQNFNSTLIEKCKIFDIIITPCMGTVNKYKMYTGKNDVYFMPSGYDPQYFHPLDNKGDDQDVDDRNNYECDISFIVYNIYNDPYYKHQHIKRKQLIDDIIELSDAKRYTVKLYGPPQIKEMYPNNYSGDISYMDQHKLFCSSKINIVTHPFCNYSVPISDLEMKILGSRGLLVTDRFKDVDKFLKDGINCVVLDANKYIQQIENILDNTDKYEDVRQNGLIFSKDFTWNEWVKKLHIHINKIHFDHNLYRKLYDIDIDDDNKLWDHWVENGIAENHVCCHLNVPKEFNYEEYKNFFGLKFDDPEKLYIHWDKKSKDMSFMKKQRGSVHSVLFDADKVSATTEDIFDFFSIFNSIYSYNCKDKGLEKIKAKSFYCPRVDINHILNSYFELIE